MKNMHIKYDKIWKQNMTTFINITDFVWSYFDVLNVKQYSCSGFIVGKFIVYNQYVYFIYIYNLLETKTTKVLHFM